MNKPRENRAGTEDLWRLTMERQAESERRFEFGKNWRSFLTLVDDQRIQASERKLSISPLKFPERLPWLSHAAFFV